MMLNTFRRIAFLLLVATSILPTANGQTLRILPMGDSITDGSSFDSPDGTGGYRGPLYDSLTNAGFTIDYVGTSTVNSSQLVEKEHEGHSGWRIDQLDSNVTAWFAAIDTPDFVLLHIGTNDFGQGNDTSNAINRLDALITKMVGLSPTTHIIVTNIMARGEPQNTAIQAEFNPFVEGLVNTHIGNGEPVSFLDMRAAVPLSDMPDNLHPNQTGYHKMAAAWHGAIIALLDPGDEIPPAIVSAKGAESADQVKIAFNRTLDKVSAETLTNYTIDNGVSVLGAELSLNERLVTLTTSPQTLGTSYTLTINNLRDQVAPTPNTIAGNTTALFFAATPSGYFNNIEESNCYTLVYSLDIPSDANYSAGAVPYDIDYRNRVGGFDRIAYYMELQTPDGDLQYAWASMDAFTSNLEEIGVPAPGTGATFQQSVTNMNVVSNVPTVTNGAGLAGNLEFWPTNYGAGNAVGVPGASDGVLDFGDTNNGSGSYASMQVHNTTAAQTVIAFNRWGGGFAAPIDIGIGSNTGTHPDWTFEQNGAGFSIRKLQVLVRTSGDLTPPTLASAEASFGGDSVIVRFSEPVRAETLLASNFSLDNGVAVLGVTIGSDLRQVTLQTTAHPAEALTLTVSHLRDTSQNANLIAPASMVPVGQPALPAEIVTNIGASANGYELLYTIDIPVTGNFNASDAAYIVDNSSGVSGFSRVAYYLELQTAGNPVEYVWAAMDAFTTNPAHLGVPTVGSGAFFQTLVTDLEVISNKTGIVSGSGIATGNIEFWPSNYNGSNALAIPNANGATFDFGDGNAATNAGYGSMQIHNHAAAAAQTLLAMNHFGTDGQPLCLGIGNNPAPVNNGVDWTFSDNAASYTRRVMHVMVLPTPPPSVPTEVLANVPESSSYELVYSLDVPANGNLSGGAGFAAYDVDASSSVDSFSRVAYYLELQKTGDAEPTFVWVSMDAFTPERSKIGVPNVASGAVWQQLVSNLNIVSNSANVTTGTGLSGNLEFWPGNYNGGNDLNIPNASPVTFDFGDGAASSSFGHGSMQVHNYDAQETLFAINRWGSNANTTNALAIGIGNNQTITNNDPDYTFTYNAPGYDLRRRLHVLVLPGPSPFGGPQFASAMSSSRLDRLSVRFDGEVSDSSADASNFTIDGGLSITGAAMVAGNREVILTTTPQTPGTLYTVTANGGVFGRNAGGAEIEAGEEVQFTAFTPPAALANVPDSGYELIYQLTIPANKPQWNLNPISYSIDEAKYGEVLFDRVAYLMALDDDWVYVSFDSHTNEIAKIGVPSFQVSGTPFQQIVSNMNVASNVDGIVTGNDITTGNIEFWGGNYQQANGISIPGANGGTYDFGDVMTAGGHGSMQVHNHGASQTLFAYNNWGSNTGGVSDVGIGNNTGTGDPDYTFSDNGADFTARTLYVLARPGGSPSGEAPEILSHPCDREVAVGGNVTFAVDLLGSGPFTYQWRCNGVVIPGETFAWLELTNVTSADVAYYDVVVTGPNLVPVISKSGLLTLDGTPLGALVSWRIANGFHPSDGSAPGDGDLEDRESDSLSNLLEFGFGTDPNVSDNVQLVIDGSVNGTPIVDPSLGGGASFDAVFTRRDDHGQPGSLIYTVQFSSDLLNFHDSPEEPTFVADSSADPDYEVVKVAYPVFTPDGRKVRYFRVKVALVP
ncbi:GDSL-type esterase/lipase family protein [Verrucomicrobiaceae bacterium 227]